MEGIRTLINRLKANTPLFFKRIRNVGLFLLGAATSALGVLATYGINLTEEEMSWFKMVIVAGAVMSATAQCAKEDK